MDKIIRVDYEPRPYSNVGKYVARFYGLGMRTVRSVVSNQALSGDANARRAADVLATSYGVEILGEWQPDESARKLYPSARWYRADYATVTAKGGVL